MKLLKKISSIFIAVCLMLNVFAFVGAAPASEAEIRQYLNGIQITDATTKNKKVLSEYPDVVNVVTALLLDLKVEQGDFNASDINKLGYFLQNPSLDGVDNPKYVINGLLNVIGMVQFVSGYSVPDGCASDMDYQGVIGYVKESNGNKKKRFYWINKNKAKEYVKSLIDGKVAIQDKDYDSLFLKHTEEMIIKYFGGTEAVFGDDGLFAKFVQSIIEIMKDNTIGLQLSEYGFTKQPSEKRVEVVSDYKKMGQYLVKSILGHKGLEEGKDYEVSYDDETGYIKEIKKLSSEKSKDESSSVSESSPSMKDQLMKNVFIVACVLLVVIVIAAAVILVYALIKRKR